MRLSSWSRGCLGLDWLEMDRVIDWAKTEIDVSPVFSFFSLSTQQEREERKKGRGWEDFRIASTFSLCACVYLSIHTHSDKSGSSDHEVKEGGRTRRKKNFLSPSSSFSSLSFLSASLFGSPLLLPSCLCALLSWFLVLSLQSVFHLAIYRPSVYHSIFIHLSLFLQIWVSLSLYRSIFLSLYLPLSVLCDVLFVLSWARVACAQAGISRLLISHFENTSGLYTDICICLSLSIFCMYWTSVSLTQRKKGEKMQRKWKRKKENCEERRKRRTASVTWWRN